MGSNSTQGWALLLFLVGFVCLAGAFFTGGSVLLVLLFFATTAGSVAMFLKAKPWEHAER
jgi:hypothetical protein